MLGFELKVVEAHGRRRRRKAQRHLTLLPDAVTSHRKTPPCRKSKSAQPEKMRVPWMNCVQRLHTLRNN